MTVIRTDVIPNLYANPIKSISKASTAVVTVPVTAAVVSATGTIGTVTGSGTFASPWTATITGLSSTATMVIGAQITATAGTGTFNGAPTVGTPFIVTAVATNGNITLNTSAANLLVVGQPIVFTNPLSPLSTTQGVVPFQTYYVLSVSTVTITVAATWPSTTAVTFSAAWSSQSTVAGFYAIPQYYVKTVLDSRRIMLSATLNGASWPLTNASGTVPGNYTVGTNVMTINSLPSYTDFIEHDVTLSPNGTFERTGILVPPNTYLYVSSSAPQVSVVATGIQETV